MNNKLFNRIIIVYFLILLLSGCGGGTGTSGKDSMDERDFHTDAETLSSDTVDTNTVEDYQEGQSNPIIDNENGSNDIVSEGNTDIDNSNIEGDDDSGSGNVYDPPHNRSVTITWSPPTKDADRSPLTGLSGYIVYYGPSPDNYTHLIYTNITHTTIKDLPSGTCCFAVTAYDDWGNESKHSEGICISIN